MGDKNNAGRDILDMFIVKEDASVEERTFFKDELLPSLPLPSIQQTIEKYLDSCRAGLYRNNVRISDYQYCTLFLFFFPGSLF